MFSNFLAGDSPVLSGILLTMYVCIKLLSNILIVLILVSKRRMTMKWSTEQIDQLFKQIDVNNDGKIAIWECIIAVLSIKSRAMRRDVAKLANATISSLRNKEWITGVVKDYIKLSGDTCVNKEVHHV